MAQNKIGAGRLPPEVLRKALEGKNLNQKEQQQQKLDGQKKLSSQNAARLAQQAGFQRLGGGRRKGVFDIPNSEGPIPLPEDETQTDLWTPDRLESAQDNMVMAGAQMEEIAETAEAPGDMASGVLAGTHLPTEGGVRKLQALKERPAPEPIPMDEVSQTIEKSFGIKFSKKMREERKGQVLLATALVAGGQRNSVKIVDDELDEALLADGVKNVTEKGNQDVDHARKMIKGIEGERHRHKTFMKS